MMDHRRLLTWPSRRAASATYRMHILTDRTGSSVEARDAALKDLLLQYTHRNTSFFPKSV